MESWSLEEENIIKDIRNPFRLEKEAEIIKDINYIIEILLLRDIKNIFEHEEEKNYNKLVRVSNF